MAKPMKDEEREERIRMEIIVDAYGGEEQALSSDNRFKRLDITSTRDLLGYAPQDDAFDIFGDHLREWLQD